MTPGTAVISGASIAGLSTAFWLLRCGWRVTVLERAEAFRDGGQNIDVRGVAHTVLDRMGLTEAVRALNTTETTTVFVDADGEVITELPSDGPDGATAELEILRGDLARTILDALPDGVDMRYGDSIESVDDDTDRVRITTTSGHILQADLLVVAEGVRSTTRALVFADDVDPRPLDITMAFGTIARTDGDDDRWRWYTTTGGRQVHLRPDPHGTTRAILAVARQAPMADLELDEARGRLRSLFADAGWQAPRVLAGFNTSDDLYVDDLTQIRMPSWHRGRVAVVGDAAWCVTPIGGGGSSLALTGGYILAAQLSHVDPADHDAVRASLHEYDAWMRPLVDDVQGLPGSVDRIAYPASRLGLAARNLMTTVMTSGPLNSLMEKVTAVADDDRQLPEMIPPDV